MTKVAKTSTSVKTLNEMFWLVMVIRQGSTDFGPRTKSVREALIRPVKHYIKNVRRILDASTKKAPTSVTVTLVTNVWIFQNLRESRWVWGRVDSDQGQEDANRNADRLLWKFAIVRNVANELIAISTTKMMFHALANLDIKDSGIHWPIIGDRTMATMDSVRELSSSSDPGEGVVTKNKIFSCEQTDECSKGMNDCDSNAVCTGLDGGYD